MRATTLYIIIFFAFFAFTVDAYGQNSQGQQQAPQQLDTNEVAKEVTSMVLERVEVPSPVYELDGIVFFDVALIAGGGYGENGGNGGGELRLETFFRLPTTEFGFFVGVGGGMEYISKPRILEGQSDEFESTFGWTNSLTIGFGFRSPMWENRHLAYGKVAWAYDEEMYSFGNKFMLGYRFEQDFNPEANENNGTAFNWLISVEVGYEENSYFYDSGWIGTVNLGILWKSR